MAKKGNNKKTPQVEKFEAVADPRDDMPKAQPIQSKEHFDEVMSREYTRPSTAAPVPVDNEGLSLLSNSELSRVYGVHPDTVKKWTHTKNMPHYVERKGMGSSGEDRLQRGTRTWHRMEDVIRYMDEEDPFGDLSKPLKRRRDEERASVRAKRAAGETVHTFDNPHPRHEYLRDRLRWFPKGRVLPPAGGTTSNDDEPLITSNITDALGSSKSVGKKMSRLPKRKP